MKARPPLPSPCCIEISVIAQPLAASPHTARVMGSTPEGMDKAPSERVLRWATVRRNQSAEARPEVTIAC